MLFSKGLASKRSRALRGAGVRGRQLATLPAWGGGSYDGVREAQVTRDGSFARSHFITGVGLGGSLSAGLLYSLDLRFPLPVEFVSMRAG